MDLCVVCGNYVSGDSHVCSDCIKNNNDLEDETINIECCSCKSKIDFYYYYAAVDYYCEDCIYEVYNKRTWNILHSKYPDEYYMSSFSKNYYGEKNDVI